MKELTVIAKNDVGALAAVAEALGNVGVNIEAISCYGQDRNAVFRIITADVASATKTLNRITGVQTKEADILIVRMINRPGELGKITTKLANHGINLESLYIMGKKENFTEVAIKPAAEHIQKTRELLGIKE
jgi:hypothetical protein